MEYYNDYRQWLLGWLTSTGMPDGIVSSIAFIADVFILTILCIFVYFLTKIILVFVFKRLISKYKIPGKEFFIGSKVVVPFAHITPALVIKAFIPIIFSKHETLIFFFNALTDVYLIVAVTFVIVRFITSITRGLAQTPTLRDKPVESYSQLVKIIAWIVAVILIFAIVLNKSPVYLLSALGALTAVLILVFKDTLLGFVASIQISAYDMIRPGDWITMPKHDADGDVIAINLNTVKVQNFDKTIVMVPTYSFISESFINWRGMTISGGRRIKRSIFINVNSIKFCTKEMLDKYKKYELIEDYIESREHEITEYNKKHNVNKFELINGRNLTNVGVFRKYVEQYLLNDVKVKKKPGFTLMVRQLQPVDKGLPLEVYAFADTVDWVEYENIQSDIFDHLLSAVRDFDLTIFQNPTGMDIRSLKS